MSLCSRHSGFDFRDGNWRVLAQEVRDDDPDPLAAGRTVALTDGKGALVSCHLTTEPYAWLWFGRIGGDTDLCRGPYLAVATQLRTDERGSQADRIVVGGTRVALRQGDTRIDTRAARVELRLPAPWNVRTSLPMEDGVLVAQREIFLAHPVPVKDTDVTIKTPLMLRILDAKGTVLRTCTPPQA